jgi:hypothetical protein
MLHVFTNVTEVVAKLATAGASSIVALIIPGFRRWRSKCVFIFYSPRLILM